MSFVKKAVARVAKLIRDEPVLTAAVVGAAADAVQAGIRDGLGAAQIARSVAYVVLGVIVRTKVSPATKPTPAPVPVPAPAPDPAPAVAPALAAPAGWAAPAKLVDDDGFPDTGAHRFHP